MLKERASRSIRSLVTLNRDREFKHLRDGLALRPGDRLLDVGSGDGFWTARFAQHCGQVLGLEPDDTLRGYAKRLHRPENVAYYAGFAECLPFPAESFDKVVSISSVEHFADPTGGLREMVRVLKPGGRLAISVDSLLPENASTEFRRWHSTRHFVTHYFHQDELLDILQQAGLEIDPPGPIHLFRSRLAAGCRAFFIRRPRLLLPLFPLAYICVRLGDRLANNMHGQILITAATKPAQVNGK